MDEPVVVSERHGNVSVLRINRPEKRNAMNAEVMAGIGRGMGDADADPDIRAVILTGTGEKAFCAGLDLAAFASGDVGGGDPAGMAGYNTFIRGGVRTPVICAANGSAVAGGFELLLACDLVVAAEHCTFGLPEVKRGLFAAGGGVFLSRRIPVAKALELALTGATISAPDAVALGLVNHVAPAGEVTAAALALAERIAANAPLAVAVTKELVRAAASEPAADVWKRQEELQTMVFGSEDAKEGSLAFVEKRSPIWKGR